MDSASREAPDAALAAAIAVARSVREAGGRALIVGGWVRDRLLGLASKDIDLEIYGIEAAALPSLLDRFGRVEPVGQSFPVYKLIPSAEKAGGAYRAQAADRGRIEVDVALPRRESKSGRGHKAFSVEGDPHMSLREAASRRDFTINAVAWDPLTGAYEDPYDGRADLARRVLRVVNRATFGDDSLRVLRALQLAARFSLTLEPESRDICAAIPLDDLPAERVWGEIEKLLVAAERPSIGFSLARELGVVERVLPEMHALIGCEQEPEWHPEGDVWIHTLLVIDRARERIADLGRPAQIAVMLAAVCHDFGKPATTAFVEGRIRSYNHEEAGVAPTLVFLDRLNVHSIEGYDVRQQVVGMVAHHLKPGMWHKAGGEVGDGAFRRLAQKVDLELLARLAKADCLGRPGPFDCSAMDWFLQRARALGVEHRPPTPLVLGRHLLELGMEPGPEVGRVLKEIYERQLDGAIDSVESGIALARAIMAGRK
jgi:tRNA nucleotidyltransferase (CCA-adding enzyme)